MFHNPEENNILSNESYECQPSAIALATFFYADSAGHTTVKRLFRRERANAWNQGFLVLYTLSGSGELRYRDDSFILSKGTSFFIDCAEPYRLQNKCADPWSFLWVHFDGQNSLGYFRQYTRRQNFFINTPGELTDIPNNILSIIQYLKTQHATFEFQISHCISGILTELLVSLGEQDRITMPIPTYIHKALRKIEADFNQNLSMAQIASSVGMSQYYFSREFKHYVGVSFTQYLIGIRMEHAKKLLRSTSLPIDQICYECGMKTVSHFISTFKKKEGRTPLAYRKLWNSDTH